MQVKLTDGESPYLTYAFKGSQNLDCYLKAVEALKYVEYGTPEGGDVARRLAKEALSLCPEHVFALCVLAWTHMNEIRFGTSKSPKESLEKAIELAQKAIALDDGYAWGHAALGFFYLFKREFDKAIDEGERAVALSPNSADMIASYARILNFLGRPDILLIKKAIRLNPFCPTWYFPILGHACLSAGQFEEAVSANKKTLQRAPDNIPAHIFLTATYSMMDREKEARAEAAEVLRINPKFSLDDYTKMLPYKDQSEMDKFVNALRKAGLK
jgi:adenylate cyclase